MRTSGIAFVLAAAMAAPAILASVADETAPTESEIVEALTKPPGKTRGVSPTRSLSGGRGIDVSGGEDEPAPSIDLKVTFALGFISLCS